LIIAMPFTPGRRRASQNGSNGRAITAPTGYREGDGLDSIHGVNWGRTDFSLFLVCHGQIVLNNAYRGGALPLANARGAAPIQRESDGAFLARR